MEFVGRPLEEFDQAPLTIGIQARFSTSYR